MANYVSHNQMVIRSSPALQGTNLEQPLKVTWPAPLLGRSWNSRQSLPSGKHTKSYGKSPFCMGKSTNSMVIFNSYVKLPEGNWLARQKNLSLQPILAHYAKPIIDARFGQESGTFRTFPVRLVSSRSPHSAASRKTRLTPGLVIPTYSKISLPAEEILHWGLSENRVYIPNEIAIVHRDNDHYPLVN